MELTIKVQLGVSDSLAALARDFIGAMPKPAASSPAADLLPLDPTLGKFVADLVFQARHSATPVVTEAQLDALDHLQPTSSALPDAEDPAMAAPISGAVVADSPAAVLPPAPLPAVAQPAAPTAKQPPPAKQAAKPAKVETLQRATLVWTAERKAYLGEAYPRGHHCDAIFTHLNTLPGIPISTPYAVKMAADKHGFRRPFPVQPSAAKPVAKPAVTIAAAPPAPALPDPTPTAPAILDFTDQPGLPATWTVAIRWAQHHGVDTIDGDDDAVLARVNFARRNRGLPPFAIDDTESLAA